MAFLRRFKFSSKIKSPQCSIHPDICLLGHVHINDDLLQGKEIDYLSHYINVGLSAIRNIEDALEIANKDFKDIKHCLDMPCGYGRVLRFLRVKIPSNRITACDINEEAVKFCASEFGAEPLVSHVDFKQINFTKRYDLIWVGSLFTHINSAAFSALLKTLYKILETDGILILTMHGEFSIEVSQAYYGINLSEADKQSIRNGGYYFSPYANSENYGISVCLKGYVLEEINHLFGNNLRLIRYKERGWDNHQDVYCFQRV